MIITKTPLRVSLLGGNTDFPKYFKKHGGAVLTTTIDKYIYCIVKKRFDDEIWVNYSEKEIVTKVSHIKHDLVREALKLNGITKGIEITFLSDIPSQGSGLGSSSAVVVGLLNALHAYKNEQVTARQLAEEACYIEVDVLKKPIGYQDQYAVAFGGTNLIRFGKKIKVIPVTVKDSKDLMLFYTGQIRSADKILSKMKLKKKILDQNKALVFNATVTSMYSLGDLLHEYWILKRKLNGAVTNDSIEKMYRDAINAGAEGGKIVGAGGGGFLLLSVPEYKKKEVHKKLALKELPFKFTQYGSRVIFNDE